MKNLLKIACVTLFAVTGSAYAAADMSPADKKAMHDYTLSMDKVKAMQAAMDDFNAQAAKDPSLKAQTKSVGDDSKSIADMEGKLQSYPRVVAIYTHHGITVHDAVVMPFVLMYAGTAAAYPSAAAKIADETSPEQIAFFKAHEAEIKKMRWLYGSGQ